MKLINDQRILNMQKKMLQAAKILDSSSKEKLLLLTHSDTDGMVANTILKVVAERMGFKSINTTCVSQLYPYAIELIYKNTSNPIMFTDLGAGGLEHIVDANQGQLTIILDHHESPEVPKLPANIHLLNSHQFEINGDEEACAASMTYLFAKTLHPANQDLAFLGVLGAIGDGHQRYRSTGQLITLDKIAAVDSNFGSLMGGLVVDNFIIRETIEKMYAEGIIGDELHKKIITYCEEGKEKINTLVHGLPEAIKKPFSQRLKRRFGHVKYESSNRKYRVSMPGSGKFEDCTKIKTIVDALATMMYLRNPEMEIANLFTPDIETSSNARSKAGMVEKNKQKMFENASKNITEILQKTEYIQWFEVGESFASTSEKTVAHFCEHLIENSDEISDDMYLFGGQRVGIQPIVGWGQGPSLIKVSVRSSPKLKYHVQKDEYPSIPYIINYISKEIQLKSKQVHSIDRGSFTTEFENLTACMRRADECIEKYLRKKEL